MNKAAPNHPTKPAALHAAHRQPGVLSGIRVLDFTWKTVGPWAPRLLTHYGAEVIHVERAGGWDDHRFAAHRSLTTDAPEPNHVQGEKPLYTDPYFNTLHHGKLAISLNTRHPEGITIVERLIPKCDAIVENFSAALFSSRAL
jgi:formyl-CoA transferase